MNPKYIDIHAHVNFVLFDEDRKDVVHRTLENDIWVINIGTQFDTSEKAVEMTNDYKEGVYATIGLHPIHTSASYHDSEEIGEKGKEIETHGEIFNKERYRELAKKGKVVGIGECGLDYFHTPKEEIEKQRVAFMEQIEISDELRIPLMLHIRNSEEDKERNAYEDALDLIKQYYNKEKESDALTVEGEDMPLRNERKGVVHFFAGNLDDALAFIDFGFYISFAGVITYPPKKNSPDYEGIIKVLPLDKIMADTDSPYVAPVPNRGKRNEPLNVRDIVAKIAEIKGLDEEFVASQIVLNARKLFNL
jgi:TatD DNase family protein